MPGILFHLSFAEMVYRKLEPILKLKKVQFLEGNIIPDLAIDKQKSHYRRKASSEGFWVPEMELAKEELLLPADSIKFGMYCHLYLDHYFIEQFLIPEFVWNAKKMKVTNPKNNKQWDVKIFFSHSGMYGAYTEIDQLMVRDKRVSMSTIKEIPEVLPNTGLHVFDERKEKTWKVELEEYLSEEKNYTGEIFDYNELLECIERIATQFIEEISNLKQNGII